MRVNDCVRWKLYRPSTTTCRLYISVFVPVPPLKLLVTSNIIGPYVHSSSRGLVFCQITLMIRYSEIKFLWLWNRSYRSVSHLPVTPFTCKSDLELEFMSRGFRDHKWQVKRVQHFRNTSRVMAANRSVMWSPVVFSPVLDPQLFILPAKAVPATSWPWNLLTPCSFVRTQ